LLAATALMFSLLAAEAVCRIALPRATSLRFKQDVKELQQIQLPQLVSVLQDDEDLFWRLIPNKVLPPESRPFFGIISNAQGLREDHEITIPKKSHELRILFLGDSCTFGYGLENRDGFIDKLEVRLRATVPQGWTVECINSGVPGYSLFQGLRFLETEGQRYQPDLVVACFGWNDMSAWDDMSDEDHWRRAQAVRPPAFLARSALCRVLWRAAKSRASAPASEPRPRILPNEFRGLLDKTLEVTRREGAELLVLSWPMRVLIEPGRSPNLRTPLQVEMHSFSTERRVPLLDLVPVFQNAARVQPLSSLYFDIGHATASANTMIADVFARELDLWIRHRTRPPQP
jgi:hypothetical protein